MAPSMTSYLGIVLMRRSNSSLGRSFNRVNYRAALYSIEAKALYCWTYKGGVGRNLVAVSFWMGFFLSWSVSFPSPWSPKVESHSRSLSSCIVLQYTTFAHISTCMLLLHHIWYEVKTSCKRRSWDRTCNLLTTSMTEWWHWPTNGSSWTDDRSIGIQR